MFNIKTRATVAALVAALTVAVAAGPASAARSMDDHDVYGGGYTFVPTGSTAVKPVTVHSTGDGESTEAECNGYEGWINDERDKEAAGIESGDSEYAEEHGQSADDYEDAALSNGCFIIY
jgi:hypothetical protein